MEIEGERERDKLKIFRVLLLDVAVAVDDDDAVSVRLLSFPVIALVSVPLASASVAAADPSVHVSCRRVAVDGGEERRAAHANDMIDERHGTLGVVRKQNIARSIGIGIRVLSLPHSKENHS